MKTSSILILCFVSLIVYNSAFSQSMGNSNYNTGSNSNFKSNKARNLATNNSDSVMFIDVHTLMNVKPDYYIAMFNISQSAASIAECNSLLTKRISGFIEKLQTFGIGERDIYIDFISQIPEFEYQTEKKVFSKTYNEIPVGFEIQKNIHIKTKDGKLISQIISMAAEFEIYDLAKVDCVAENNQQIVDSLRKTTIDYLNKKTEMLKKSGVVLNYTFYTIDEEMFTIYPDERYKAYTSYNSSSANTGKSKVNNANKKTTYYYSRLEYSDFDIVISPVILEPAIQYTYYLRAKYVLKRK